MSRKKKTANAANPNDREETQGDWAVEGIHGSSLSVGDDTGDPGASQPTAYPNPSSDKEYLEALFRDLRFPADKGAVVAYLSSKEFDVPISGMGIAAFVESFGKENFQDRLQLINALESELGRKVPGY